MTSYLIELGTQKCSRWNHPCRNVATELLGKTLFSQYLAETSLTRNQKHETQGVRSWDRHGPKKWVQWFSHLSCGSQCGNKSITSASRPSHMLLSSLAIYQSSQSFINSKNPLLVNCQSNLISKKALWRASHNEVGIHPATLWQRRSFCTCWCEWMNSERCLH